MIRLIAPIVEGHGEVGAVPVLVRRLVNVARPDAFPQINPPIRVNSGSFLNLKDPAYLRRYVELAASKAAQAGPGLILIPLDCEDDCPGQLGPSLLERARQVRPDVPCLVALACREYETWFLAAAASLRSHRGLPADLQPPTAPEALRDAKGGSIET